MYLCHGCYQGAEAASAMKKRPGREALALSIYSYIIFLRYHFFRYHFSPVPFPYDYIAELARTNLIFSSAFYLTVPCMYHIRPMSIRKKTPGRNIRCSFPEYDYYMVSVYSSSMASSSSSTSAISSIPRTSSATLSSVSPLLLSSSEESTSSSSSDSRISSEIKSSVSSFTLR